MYYLAGPMSGLPHFNYPAFIEAADKLRSRGYEIHNPAESRLGLGYDRLTYLQEDFAFIISDECEGVFVLEGWSFSAGARGEVHLAMTLQKPVIKYWSMEPLESAVLLMQNEGTYDHTAMPLQVAINGKMRSGKDTVATKLQYWTQVPIDRFARPLKEGCEHFGCGDGEIVKDRVALQDIGQYFTARHPRWWVNLLDERHPNRDKTGIIIPDLRSPEEFKWCKENGIITVRLEVDEGTQVERGAERERLQHVTETGLDGMLDEFDYVFPQGTDTDFIVSTLIAETGSFENLRDKALIEPERTPTVV